MKYDIFNSTPSLFDKKYIISLMIILCLSTAEIFGHGSHKSQPIGIIDPLVTHHAILEDELKFNYFNLKNDNENLKANLSSLEIAFAFTDLIGFEIFLPFGSVEIDGIRYSGFGDIETFIPKISFIRKYGFVKTTYIAVRIPTGDEKADLGEPGWGFAPHLLMDYGKGGFGLQVNAAAEFETEGDIALEGNVSFAYSIMLKEDNNNKLMLSPLLEFALESPLKGEELKSVLNIIPGIKIALNGWHLGLGAALPVTSAKEFDYLATMQLGYHVKWENLFK
ncbi:MAG: transporter [candidate division Zixibacteria bacterium]|nr:transporter [candidate division Zixibacteria bacterium]